MKCICGHEGPAGTWTLEAGDQPDGFKNIGYTCDVEEISTFAYYKLKVKERSALFACPKCGTVRINTDKKEKEDSPSDVERSRPSAWRIQFGG